MLFDEIEADHIDDWEAFFNYKYNTATSTGVLYGNHDYIKMFRLPTDPYLSPHNFIDRGIWKTRVKKGSFNELSDVPTNVAYIDKKYDVDFSVFDAAGNRDDAENQIYIDNFWPYIQEVTLNLKLSGGLSVPIGSVKRIASEGTANPNDGFIVNSIVSPEFMVFK